MGFGGLTPVWSTVLLLFLGLVTLLRLAARQAEARQPLAEAVNLELALREAEEKREANNEEVRRVTKKLPRSFLGADILNDVQTKYPRHSMGLP